MTRRSRHPALKSADNGRLTADVVIVGAGSAGCVLAEKLSRESGRDVVLLERGPGRWPGPEDRDLRRLPIGDRAPYAVRHATDLDGLTAARGCAVGGSSVVNGGYFLRWHQDDFADWPEGWGLEAIDAAYSELDGSDGTMGVSPVSDDELGDAGTAFERYWSSREVTRPLGVRWPVIGVNRVLGNRSGMLRRTAAEAYLEPALRRPNLRVVADCEVRRLEVSDGRRVTGVATDRFAVSAGEVILAAGTLGTARLLLGSDLEVLGGAGFLEAGEHRGLVVSYRRTDPAEPGMVLPTVLHTVDGLEIRCYRDDFAVYIEGVPPSGTMVEVTAMRRSPVKLVADRGRVRLEFGEPSPEATASMRAGADRVVEMLRSPDFAGIVVPGSVSVAAVPGFSQHAWGTMPMGVWTDALGAVYGTEGLRIVDGSILPTGGHSGPHATIMMMAVHIASRI
ncbi:mycofactocin system GMC family oxidoreductase MftG [Gordonia amicalis]|uniref:Mycofactocin system GMC family oxidoreductase MftG n=1 Tax=Gordonia amicalis TaxID=89053 RepID=A0ABU4DBC3_9ACTN|nr:mycofactocin system GMC family oxidoreductase MftG [Gordonia amicalis]MCZ4650662.1 mycofactocin system GMC family oxidoreductase MftG [Gordonia amicalis]MDJ0451731.1 mycofactocin system GMC family oxidoreductase MftG [Gordonia amicalis]MDV6306589.1 mycofactocin system GMC family oxidoreductase MftG [Gordonia amicalis]MDV7075574.1 mycofactocin system GMC family oxidoreductase MftG [Gordonia amicalis]